LEKIMGLPADILEFHLWYFREKGWIDREESGLLSITAAGVDQIESTVQSFEHTNYKRLEFTELGPVVGNITAEPTPAS
jgi:pilus assembly protein TadC